MSRMLAKIVKIDSVRKHPNADTLDLCMVGGWQVVSKAGEYKAGDYAIYCEVDSFLPVEVAPFLVKGEPKIYNGIVGERLQSIKLRGELSQGLLLSIYQFPAVIAEFHKTRLYVHGRDNSIDVTNILGIVKYEPPIPACLSGVAKGVFPSIIPKTDEERVQNLAFEFDSFLSAEWEVSEKLEGSSMTVARLSGEFQVCSRNLNLLETEGNSLWKVARLNNIEEKMVTLGLDDFVIQGELIGEGIQGNHYGIKGQELYVFRMYDVKKGKFVDTATRYSICKELGLKHVPLINECVKLSDGLGISTVGEVLEYADGKSLLNPTKLREGVVFKEISGQRHWKAISNSYLLKVGG